MKKILSSLLSVLLILSIFGCATLSGIQPVNIKDDVSILKPEAKLVGNVQFALYDSSGHLKDYREYHNLVVTTGKAGVASRINGADSEAAFTYIALGIGTTAAAAANTTLESEITTNGGERGAATCTRVTVTTTNDTAQLVKTYNFTGAFAITESGVFNDASAGTLLARRVFAAINVANLDSLQVTWKFTAS